MSFIFKCNLFNCTPVPKHPLLRNKFLVSALLWAYYILYNSIWQVSGKLMNRVNKTTHLISIPLLLWDDLRLLIHTKYKYILTFKLDTFILNQVNNRRNLINTSVINLIVPCYLRFELASIHCESFVNWGTQG